MVRKMGRHSQFRISLNYSVTLNSPGSHMNETSQSRVPSCRQKLQNTAGFLHRTVLRNRHFIVSMPLKVTSSVSSCWTLTLYDTPPSSRTLHETGICTGE